MNPASLGSKLRRYRIESGITQVELGAILGLSQSFVSRLERGLRVEISSATMEKLKRHIPEIQSGPTGADQHEESYENALILLGQGDHDQAEGVLLDVISSLSGSLMSHDPRLLQKATLRLAAIRRDRNNLRGPDGAIGLYRSVLGSPGSQRLAIEAEFMLAACDEMRGMNEKAAKAYSVLGNEALDLRTETRLSSRRGALLTKMDELPEAIRILKTAQRLAFELPDAGPFSYASEKLGIALAKSGLFDAAWKEILGARSEISVAGGLREVQSIVAEAYLMFRSGETNNGLGLLQSARDLAFNGGFNHQIDRIDSMVNKYNEY